MIRVTVIALGKLKEKYLREACSEYEKRLSRYCNLEILELEPARLSEKPSAAEVNSALEREAEAVVKKIPQNSEVIALCVEGKDITSERFAEGVEACRNSGRGITFIIGSSYGLAERVKALSKTRLSLSSMTFPHQLFRVMLLEQIYRAFKINEGSTYHK